MKIFNLQNPISINLLPHFTKSDKETLKYTTNKQLTKTLQFPSEQKTDAKYVNAIHTNKQPSLIRGSRLQLICKKGVL